MSLVANPKQPGHWVADDHVTGQPGLHAVVIGVSRYAHLDGGDEPACQTYGLGQLQVSALTAWRFFEWLRAGYQVDGCPVADVWCLLSPTEDELKLAPAMAQNALAPDFAQCCRAIRCWQAAMAKGGAAASRAVFFFSGHGIEVFQREQVLLPCDWLAPPAEVVNEAISTFNLVDGLSTLPVQQQFFFIDACRNDNQELRKRRIGGASILDVPAGADTNPDIVAPILYATAGGLQAYQQSDPSSGLSLYGTALLGGLKAEPGLAVRPVGGHPAVTLYPLQSYVSDRVTALIAAAGESVRQVVKLNGSVQDRVVTQLPDDSGGPSHFMPPDLQRRLGGDASFTPPIDAGRAAAPPLPPALQLDAAALERWRGDNGVARDYFGSEGISDLWQRATLLRLSDGGALPPEALVLRSVRHSEDQTRQFVEFEIAAHDAPGVLLEFHGNNGHSGVVLATHSDRPVGYRVEMDATFMHLVGRPPVIDRLEARLTGAGGPVRGHVQQLWEAYALQDAGRAERELAAGSALPERIRDDGLPVALALLALIALRVPKARWNRDQLWPTDGPPSPDLAVALGERALQRGSSLASQAAVAARWVEVLGRGLPLLSECFALAASRLRRWRQRLDELPPGLHQDLLALAALFDDALVDLRTDGLFVSYLGYQTTGAPALRRIDRAAPSAGG